MMNRVAIYLISDGMGGAEQVVWQTINGMSFYDSFYLIVNNEIAPYFNNLLPAERVLNIGDIFLHSKKRFRGIRYLLNNRYFSFIPWVIKSKTLAIANYLIKNEISIIHSHLDFTLFSSLRIKKRVKNIKLFHSVHSAFGFIDNKNFKPSVSLSRIDFKSVDKLIFVSKYVFNLYKSKEIFINDYEIIYNGIDRNTNDNFHRGNKINKEFEILYVGGSKYVKGYDILINTVNLLIKADPIYSFHIVVLGHISNKSNFLEMIKERGIEKYFRIEGFVKPPMHLNFFKSSDILFMPSRLEVLPVAAIEAVFYDLPIIANNVGGFPEVIKHNENGLLGNNSPEEYCDYISNIMNDYNTFLKMTKDHNHVISCNFEAQNMCEKLIKAYATS